MDLTGISLDAIIGIIGGVIGFIVKGINSRLKKHEETETTMWATIQEDLAEIKKELKEHWQNTDVHVNKTLHDIIRRKVVEKNNTGKFKPSK
jgi:uncharacterized membrane-anchored protein YhcB (DUF1043 family)